MSQAHPTYRPWALVVAALLGLTMLAPAAGAIPLADAPGVGDPVRACQQDWARLAPAATPDIAFLSQEACLQAAAEGVTIVPVGLDPNAPPPIGNSDGLPTTDRDGDGVPDYRDPAPDDAAITIGADCAPIAPLTLLDLANADLRNCDLGGLVPLPDSNMAGANLAGANLTGAHLEEVDLTGVDLRAANLTRAELVRSILSNADLTGATLTDATLFASDLAGATMPGVNLAGVDLIYANLTGANLSSTDLTNATLRSTNLTDANLVGARLIGADLSNADLTNANLTGATGDRLTRVGGVTWLNTLCPSGARSTNAVTGCLGDIYTAWGWRG